MSVLDYRQLKKEFYAKQKKELRERMLNKKEDTMILAEKRIKNATKNAWCGKYINVK